MWDILALVIVGVCLPTCFATTFQCGPEACDLALGDTCERVLFTNNFRGSCCSLYFNETLGECFLKVSGGDCSMKNRLFDCSSKGGQVSCQDGVEFDFETGSNAKCPASDYSIVDEPEANHYGDGLVMSLKGFTNTSEEALTAWKQLTSIHIMKYFQASPFALVQDVISYVDPVFSELVQENGGVPTMLLTYYQVAAWRTPGEVRDIRPEYVVSQPFVEPQSKAIYLTTLQQIFPEITEVSFAKLSEYDLTLSIELVGISSLSRREANDWAFAYEDHVLQYLTTTFPNIRGGTNTLVTIRGVNEISDSDVRRRRLQPAVQIVFDQFVSYRSREKNGISPEDFYVAPFQGDQAASFVSYLQFVNVNFTDVSNVIVRTNSGALPSGATPPVESPVTPPSGDDASPAIETPTADDSTVIDTSCGMSLASKITSLLSIMMLVLV